MWSRRALAALSCASIVLAGADKNPGQAGKPTHAVGAIGSSVGSRDSPNFHERNALGRRDLTDFDQDGDDWSDFFWKVRRGSRRRCAMMGQESSLIEFNQVTIGLMWFETAMFFTSCLATYRHFQEAGGRFR